MSPSRSTGWHLGFPPATRFLSLDIIMGLDSWDRWPYKQMLLDNGRCGTWEKLGFRCTGAPGSNTSTLSDSHVVTHIFPTCGRGKPPRSAAISAPPSAPSQASNSWRSGAVVVQRADRCHPFCPRRSGQAGFSPKSQ